jgi:hypothetical protein
MCSEQVTKEDTRTATMGSAKKAKVLGESTRDVEGKMKKLNVK